MDVVDISTVMTVFAIITVHRRNHRFVMGVMGAATYEGFLGGDEWCMISQETRK